MTPDLIACDVDGTLLDDDEKITARTREAVLAAVDSGAQFVLATGRPPRWVRPVVDALGFAPMAVCANGAVIYDPSTDRIVSARTLSADALGELAEIATRVIPGAGLAVERVGSSAHDAATPQFVSSPGYEHAWLNPDNTEVSIEDLLSAPAIKLLIRKAGARSSDMAAVFAKHVGLQGRYHLLDQQRTRSRSCRLASARPPVSRKWHGRRASPPRTWWHSATCPTTCRCCAGPGSGWRWATHIPMRWLRPTRSPRPTPTTAWPACWNAGGSDASGGSIGGVNRSSWIGSARRRTAVAALRGTPSMTRVTVPFSRSKFSVPCWKFCTIHCGSWISPLVGRPSAPRS